MWLQRIQAQIYSQASKNKSDICWKMRCTFNFLLHLVSGEGERKTHVLWGALITFGLSLELRVGCKQAMQVFYEPISFDHLANLQGVKWIHQAATVMAGRPCRELHGDNMICTLYVHTGSTYSDQVMCRTCSSDDLMMITQFLMGFFIMRCSQVKFQPWMS